MLEISMQTTGQMITIIVGSISIIVVLNKSIKWLKSNPVKRYIEQVSLNKLLEEKLITIHEQLNENDKKLLRDYKQRENTKTKVIDDIQEYDGDSHIKLKNLGLINEVINNTKSTNKIKEIITTTIEEQKLNHQLQQLQEIQKIVGQQIGQLNGSNVIQLTTEQLTAIENQEKTQQQEIEQLQSKLTQLQQIQQQIQQQMQTQPQQQQLLQEQINQIATQQQQMVRQIQQLNNQLFQLRQTKEALQNNANQKTMLEQQQTQLKQQIHELQQQQTKIIENQLNASLVIDLIIANIGNDILDILDKKVTDSDIKSRLAFYKYVNIYSKNNA